MKKIKSVLALLTAGVLGFSLAACGNSSENKSDSDNSEESIVIRVSHPTTSQYATELAIAEKKGFFEEAFEGKNVTVEFAVFGTGPAIMEAMAAGELDFAHGVGDQPTISSVVNSGSGVIVARTVLNAKGNGIFVDYDSDINTVEDLKGKVIAVNLGSAGQKGLDLILEDHGLSESDVQLLNLKNIDEIFAAFEKNEIDAAVSAEMALSEQKALDGQIARKLVDFTSHPNYAYLTVHTDFAAAHPEETQEFINALYKAGQWYNENTEEGDKLVAEFLDVDLEDVVTANASSEIYIDFTDDDIQNIQDTYDFLKRNDLLSNELDDISVTYDDSYVKNISTE